MRNRHFAAIALLTLSLAGCQAPQPNAVPTARLQIERSDVLTGPTTSRSYIQDAQATPAATISNGTIVDPSEPESF